MFLFHIHARLRSTDPAMGARAEKPDELIQTINSEIDTYETKHEEFFAKNYGIIQEAEAILSGEGPVQTQLVASEKSAFRHSLSRQPKLPTALSSEPRYSTAETQPEGRKKISARILEAPNP